MSLLEVQNLSHAFSTPKGDLEILDQVELRLEEGESLSILGPSGSGKSTLLSLLAGLEPPRQGSIKILGTEITELSPEALARFRGASIGFVFQSFRLMPSLTALENVALPLTLRGDPEAGERAESALDRVGLSARSHHLPSALSGGEQQRVALARAWAQRPSLLLADEPTGSLDQETAREVSDLLFEGRPAQGALVLVTHDPSLASRADRVVRLKGGRLVPEATP